MLECGSRPSDSEPKGSLDAYSSMQYQMIMGRREDAFSVGRILGDHVWPDLGDHRGWNDRIRDLPGMSQATVFVVPFKPSDVSGYLPEWKWDRLSEE